MIHVCVHLVGNPPDCLALRAASAASAHASLGASRARPWAAAAAAAAAEATARVKPAHLDQLCRVGGRRSGSARIGSTRIKVATR